MNPAGRVAYVGSFVAGAALLTMLALAGAILFHEFQAKGVRCYSLTATVAQTEKRLLNGKTYECSSQACRLVLKFDAGHGLACYFSLQFEGESSLVSVRLPAKATSGKSRH